MIQRLEGEGWQLREALGDTWQWVVSKLIDRRNSVTSAADSAVWIPARVPGSVLDNLIRAGEVPEPRQARRSREVEWVGDRHWVYRRSVELPDLEPGEAAWLELDGIDPGGSVFWDGREVGTVDGLFRALRVRLGEAGEPEVSPGPHTLAVVVRPALDTEPQVGRTERVRRLAPRVGSGWDFAPRMRHQGVWRGVRLVTGSSVFASVHARTHVDVGDPAGEVVIDATVAGAGTTVTAELSLDGRSTAAASVELVGPSARLKLSVPDVRRWWPAGMGDQVLYELRVTVSDHGRLLDERVMRVAFRSARLIPNPGAPSTALGYTAEVNGRVLPLVGWNWAPADLLFGAIEHQRVDHLLDLAVESGARILRVWGGGLLESDHFYDACDERGLLVWQELPQSSSGITSTPATDADFIARAVEETTMAAARLARHPSLFLWCGGNELEDAAGPLDEARSPVLAAMRSALARIDPGRPWLPTSPSGPTFHHRLDRIAEAPDDQHDVHGPWEHQGLIGQHTLADAGTSLAHTEFGVEGMASMRSLRAIVPAGRRWPADLSNPVYRHLGQWWNNAGLVADSFGGRIADLARMQRASQWLQATGLQYAIEADRRRWPRCSMVLPWQLAESFPNAWCTSVVEWSGEAKPALHAARRAFGRNRATIRTAQSAWGDASDPAAQVWLWAEDGIERGSELRFLLRDADGAILAETNVTDLPAIAAPTAVAALVVPRPPEGGIAIWEARWHGPDGTLVDLERTVASLGSDLAPLTELRPAHVTVRVVEQGDDWSVTIAHTGGPAVVGPALHDGRPWGAPGSVIVRDDPRPLLPGERRTLAVRWSGVPAEERMLSLDAWNVEPLTVRPSPDALPGERS